MDLNKKLILENDCSDGSKVSVTINLPLSKLSKISANLTAGRVWPACIVLAHFLLYHRKRFQDINILEFGSGMAIPSLVALKEGSVGGVFLQELDIKDLLEMQRVIFTANDLSISAPKFNQLPLKWGMMPEQLVSPHQNRPIGLFIAADCLYERNDFADLVATAAYMMGKHGETGARWVMCYQDRNLMYSIDELFDFWGLKSEIIPFKSFAFNPKHFISLNDPTIIDDFPAEGACQDVLYLLEICKKDENFIFAI